MSNCPFNKECWLADTCNAIDYCEQPLIEKSWNRSKKQEEKANDIRNNPSDRQGK